MKRGKSQTKRKKIHHPEAKGLFLLALSLLLFLAQSSFSHYTPSQNFLGIVGYLTAYAVGYLFGLGSYLIIILTAVTSLKLLFKKQIKYPKFKICCFLILLISLCILLNALAETYPHKISFLEKKFYSETILVLSPYPHAYLRYNLGGVPFYYIYKDLPHFNLQNLLSNTGTFLLLSMTSSLSFLLLTGIEITPTFKLCLSGIISFVKKAKHIPPYLFKKAIFTSKPPSPKLKTSLIKKSHIPPKSPFLEERIQETNISYTSSTNIPISIPPSKRTSYSTPSINLLSDPPEIDHPTIKKELTKQATILEDTLRSFSIEAKVGQIHCGPTITSFEVHPSIGVKVQKIKALERDIALNLQAKSIRIIAPIPGKAAVGVEIPSLYPQEVSFKEMLLHYHIKPRRFSIPILLGKTVTGDYVMADLVKMPHLLIAGATGSGKSICINTIVMSILMNLSCDEIKLLMIDPKKVELTQYSCLPHMIAPVITEAHGAYSALQWLVQEMHSRYEILKQLGLRNIAAFNNRKRKKDVEEGSIPIPEKMPLIIAIVDEFADLMMVSSTDLETPIARIAQMARAVGIHLILATQRPSREVITGIIKANFPSRIAFKVASRINSQIILDETGAESLLGNGDLLFLPPGSSHLVRAQGAYISDEDINNIISSISKKAAPSYMISSFDALKLPHEERESTSRDRLYEQALEIVLASKNASTTFLQRKLKIGYARAASLMDELEEQGVIGPPEKARPRKILATKSQFFSTEK